MLSSQNDRIEFLVKQMNFFLTKLIKKLPSTLFKFLGQKFRKRSEYGTLKRKFLLRDQPTKIIENKIFTRVFLFFLKRKKLK